MLFYGFQLSSENRTSVTSITSVSVPKYWPRDFILIILLLQLIYPLYRFREAGFTTFTIGPAKDNTYKGKHGYPVKADFSIDDIKSEVKLAMMRRHGQVVNIKACGMNPGLGSKLKKEEVIAYISYVYNSSCLDLEVKLCTV